MLSSGRPAGHGVHARLNKNAESRSFIGTHFQIFGLKIFIKSPPKEAAYRAEFHSLIWRISVKGCSSSEGSSSKFLPASFFAALCGNTVFSATMSHSQMVITGRYLNTIKGSSLNQAHKFKTNFNLVLALLILLRRFAEEIKPLCFCRVYCRGSSEIHIVSFNHLTMVPWNLVHQQYAHSSLMF